MDLRILGKLLSQGRYTSLQMFSLTRVLSLNVSVHASGIQLKYNKPYVSVKITRWEEAKDRTRFHWGGDSCADSLIQKQNWDLRILPLLILATLGLALAPVLRFLALGTSFLFSRAWYRFYVFPRLAPVVPFALGYDWLVDLFRLRWLAIFNHNGPGFMTTIREAI